MSRSNLFTLFNPKNIRGMFVFFFGILAVIYGFTLLGFIIETIGVYLLFSDKLPTFKSIFKGLLFKILGACR